ncbi:hypothetical protein HYT55_00105 [Candidatus Woesearchaeota archaeon]|nr:hypothetical protein [Candidatus Woesearchaeota archaeon]
MSWRAEVSRTLFNRFLFWFFLLLLIPLALAGTTIQTDASSYKPGEAVTISGVCSSPSVPVGLRALLDGETVWFDQAMSDLQSHYTSQFVPPQKGTYIISAACQSDMAVTTQVTVADAVVEPIDTNNNGGSPGGGPSGSPKKTTTTPIAQECEESWACGEWSGCSGGFQVRDCFDDNQCGTFALQPETSKSCYVASSQQPTPQKPFFPQVTQAVSSFWDDYMYWVIGVPLGILLLILLFVLLRALFRKKLVYDEAEIKAWAKKERMAGTSLEDVKEIVHQYTHWDKNKIEMMFIGLK